MAVWSTLVTLSALAAVLQLPAVVAPGLDADDVAVIRAAVEATAVADARRQAPGRELLVLDKTVVFCSSPKASRVCMREYVDLPSGQRTQLPLPLPNLQIRGTRPITRRALDAAMSGSDPGVIWRTFYRTYPQAAGFTAVSAPAYDSGTARVYVRFSYGGLGAKAWAVRLARSGGSWRVTGVDLLSMS